MTIAAINRPSLWRPIFLRGETMNENEKMNIYFIVENDCLYRAVSMPTLPDFPDTVRKELILTKRAFISLYKLWIEGSSEDKE